MRLEWAIHLHPHSVGPTAKPLSLTSSLLNPIEHPFSLSLSLSSISSQHGLHLCKFIPPIKGFPSFPFSPFNISTHFLQIHLFLFAVLFFPPDATFQFQKKHWYSIPCILFLYFTFY